MCCVSLTLTRKQKSPIPLDLEGRKQRNEYVREVVEMYKQRMEWDMLPDVRRQVESIEAMIQSS